MPFDESLALATAELGRSIRLQGLSLGDRACLDLTRALGQPALTADKAWSGLGVEADVTLIR